MNSDLFIEEHVNVDELPDPKPVLCAIAPGVVEVLAGVRSIEQLSANLSEGVYLKLRDRAQAMARARSQSKETYQRPDVVVKNLHHETHRPGVVQSVVLLKTKIRTRAVAIRLEIHNRRWLATSVSIL
jgi:Family of unknown function (DUF6459)